MKQEFKEYILKYSKQYNVPVGTAIMHKIVLEYGYCLGLTNADMLWVVKEIVDGNKGTD